MKCMKAVLALIICVSIALLAGCSRGGSEATATATAAATQVQTPPGSFSEKLAMLRSGLDALEDEADDSDADIDDADGDDLPEVIDEEVELGK